MYHYATAAAATTTCHRHPVEAVKMAVGICRQAEAVFDFKHHYDFLAEVGAAAGWLCACVAAAHA
jgi:pyruvate kinase